MSIGYGDLRKGMAIELDGQPYIVAEYERSKMQKRAPVMRVKFRELKTGRLVERTFQGFDVKLTPASVERRKAQYIYSEDDLYYFMDSETFDKRSSDTSPSMADRRVELSFICDKLRSLGKSKCFAKALIRGCASTNLYNNAAVHSHGNASRPSCSNRSFSRDARYF